MRLLSLSVYYQNDTPNGFGFTLLNEDLNLDSAMATSRENYSLMWAESVKEGSEKQLVAKGTLEMTYPLLWIAVGNVWLLTEMGVMGEDDVNGLMFVYEE